MKKTINVLLSIIFIFILPIVLIYSNLTISAFDRSFFEKEFQKYDRADYLGISQEDLLKINDGTLKYLEGKEENLDFQVSMNGEMREFYSEQDKEHMIDVKNIFVNFQFLRNIGFIFILCYIFYVRISSQDYGKIISRNVLISCLGFIGICAVLMALMAIDFNKYFTVFHLIFFTNDLWLMDPIKDMLVNIYPEEFFIDIAFRIAQTGVATFTILAIIAGVVFKKCRTQKKGRTL